MKLASRFVWLIIVAMLLGAAWSDLKAETTPGDLTGDNIVDMLDVVVLMDWWMQDNCGDILNCFGVDTSGPVGEPDGIINFYDFTTVAANWMVGIEHPKEEPPFPL